MYKLSDASYKNLNRVNPKLIQLLVESIKYCPLDFGIPGTGGFRTALAQSILFAKGVSKADGVNNKSYHQTGNAFDVYAYVDGKASWDPRHLSIIAKHIKKTAKRLKIDITWGGDWKNFVDMPHYQLNK